MNDKEGDMNTKEDYKVEYISKKIADKLKGDMDFCPIYYNSYSWEILYDGEIGCKYNPCRRYVIKED